MAFLAPYPNMFVIQLWVNIHKFLNNLLDLDGLFIMAGNDKLIIQDK